MAFLSGFYHVHLALVGGSRAVLSGTGYFGKVPKPGFRIGFTGMTGQAKLFLFFRCHSYADIYEHYDR